MAEWLGSLMGSWPFWAMTIGIVVVLLATAAYYYFVAFGDWPFAKKEWWQDREKRRAKARANKVAKAKKG